MGKRSDVRAVLNRPAEVRAVFHAVVAGARKHDDAVRIQDFRRRDGDPGSEAEKNLPL